MERSERVEKANELIRFIASCGKKYFYRPLNGHVAKFELATNGRLWYVTEYGDRMFTHSHVRGWKRFSGGGTLKALVKDLSVWVYHGKSVPSHHFGPWPEWYADGDLWDYGDDMVKVREKAKELGIIEEDV